MRSKSHINDYILQTQDFFPWFTLKPRLHLREGDVNALCRKKMGCPWSCLFKNYHFLTNPSQDLWPKFVSLAALGELLASLNFAKTSSRWPLLPLSGPCHYQTFFQCLTRLAGYSQLSLAFLLGATICRGGTEGLILGLSICEIPIAPHMWITQFPDAFPFIRQSSFNSHSSRDV